ncbi:MAG: DUF4231 domain-containing protein [Chloroflexi bacterium]|uniref:DUF4231 domain-containing protein n=1 Tax=Candidatus Flexifilum breve TaxID=3140694 RepID=UPI00313624ED|nr:DUF4231 domain-containing protein [Chloroflexota bacterium]
MSGPVQHADSSLHSEAPNTQAEKKYRVGWPDWMQFLPYFHFQPAEPQLTPLIKPEELEALLADASPETSNAIRTDIKFLEEEMLRLFRERDHMASKQQNAYRLYQILFLVLAAVATAFGSFQALALAGSDRNWLAVWGLLETVVALLAVFLATISGREPPLPLWMTNRRRAEQLRREYFRFLMNLLPYNELDSVGRRVKLSERVADINRGVFPDEGL